ncbi:MAG: SGNH/GDSL hydrolase family protein [Clostridia bacterium]|nr:SGNH/GDSL hydrolase family protein [Clostridia bacterium]
MKKSNIILRKAVSVLIAALLVAGIGCAALPASAGTQLLVVGDSISTGYGLVDYSSSNPYVCASYANRLAAYLGVSQNNGYVNRAQDGATSGDVLAILKTLGSKLTDADLIVISAGGNDLLRLISTLASSISGTDGADLKTALTTLLSAGADRIVEALGSIDMKNTFDTAISNYGKNVTAIIDLIREKNPSARVIFLAQYDPISALVNLQSAITLPTGSVDIPGVGTVTMPADVGIETSASGTVEIPKVDISSVIAGLNAELRKAAEGRDVEIADVPSVIDASAVARTNILQLDIHPNAAGHGAIFELLTSMLGGESTVETACEHEWGEWVEVSETPEWEPYVATRECLKCGERETKEFPAKNPDAKPAETDEATTEAGTTGTDAGENTTENNSFDITKIGCGGFASAGVLAVLLPAALVIGRKRR